MAYDDKKESKKEEPKVEENKNITTEEHQAKRAAQRCGS